MDYTIYAYTNVPDRFTDQLREWGIDFKQLEELPMGYYSYRLDAFDSNDFAPVFESTLAITAFEYSLKFLVSRLKEKLEIAKQATKEQGSDTQVFLEEYITDEVIEDFARSHVEHHFERQNNPTGAAVNDFLDALLDQIRAEGEIES